MYHVREILNSTDLKVSEKLGNFTFGWRSGLGRISLFNKSTVVAKNFKGSSVVSYLYLTSLPKGFNVLSVKIGLCGASEKSEFFYLDMRQP